MRIVGRHNSSDSTWKRVRNLQRYYWQRIFRRIEKELEASALKTPSEIDGRALMWTYESLDEDHELEQFFAGIPRFCCSNVVDDPNFCLDSLRSWTVAEALKGFLERTWSSNLVSETIKIRRLAICSRAIDAAHLSNAAHKILYEFCKDRPALFRSVELGHALISWGNNDDRKSTLFVQCIIACVIANVPQRNERWFSLTTHHLSISEHVLRGYLDHGDSVLLANLIHFTHQFIRNFPRANWGWFPISFIYGWLESNFDVQNTLPGLQHDFCDLWNKIVLQRRDRGHNLLLIILEKIHPVYVALHQGSTPFNRYRLCSTPSHLKDSAANLDDADGGRTADMARAPLTTSSALLHHDAVPSVIPPVAEHNGPPFSTSNLDHTTPHLVDEQSRNAVLDNSTPVASSVHLSPLKNDRISDGTAADPIKVSTGSFAISSIINTGSRSASVHGIASRPTGSMTVATPPSFVLDTVPSRISMLTVSSPDPGENHISLNSTANRSDRPQDDRSISPSSSQNLTPFPLAPQVISSGFDSNATEIGPLDAPDENLDPNRRIISRSFTPSSPDVAEYSLRPEDGDPSEISGPSQ